MGLEFNGGTLYMATFDGDQVELSNNLNGLVEVDTLSADEVPDVSYNFMKDLNTSFEAAFNMSALDLDLLCVPTFEPKGDFFIEHDVPIMTQTRWHRKRRINKKWVKRYGMKEDTVKIKAVARAMSHMSDTGEFNIDVDKLEYVWRPDQLRKNLKIEI